MIDYNELEKYYTGNIIPVIANCGGMFLELGEDIPTVLYKLDDRCYADVLHERRVAQTFGNGALVTSSYVVDEDSLVPVSTKEEIKENVGVIRRLTFKPDNYR